MANGKKGRKFGAIRFKRYRQEKRVAPTIRELRKIRQNPMVLLGISIAGGVVTALMLSLVIKPVLDDIAPAVRAARTPVTYVSEDYYSQRPIFPY